MNKKGFALVELIIVIVILAILAGIAIPSINGLVEKSKIAADKASLRLLNGAASLYGATAVTTPSNSDIFQGIATDAGRMAILKDNGYLTDILSPQQKNALFQWGIPEQTWMVYITDTPIPVVYTLEKYFNTTSIYNQNATSSIRDYDKSGGLNIVIPPVINGVTITTIGQDAFNTDLKGSGKLVSVVLPGGLTLIGGNAFKGNSLSSIIIPNSVTSIGANSFRGNILTSVTIGSSVKTISGGAFSNNNITSIVFPDSVTSIQDHAFDGNSITRITIGNSVTLTNVLSVGKYGSAFKSLYDGNGKQSGTYVYGSGVWVKQ